MIGYKQEKTFHKIQLDWIEKYGYQIAGSTREVYLHYEREGDPNQYVTEVQIPVEKSHEVA